jgi:hypothetical protein
MNQAASLQETIAKGKRHYYDGVTFRNWKIGMLKMYGHDARPFLDEAWTAIVGEAESRASAYREKKTSSKSVGAGTRANAKRSGPITFFGNAIMLALNVIACLALFEAWRSGILHSSNTKLPWICFTAFTYSALWRRKDGAVIICLPFACLFNPFYPIHLTRSLWIAVDIVSFFLLVAISFGVLADRKK